MTVAAGKIAGSITLTDTRYVVPSSCSMVKFTLELREGCGLGGEVVDVTLEGVGQYLGHAVRVMGGHEVASSILMSAGRAAQAARSRSLASR